MILEVKKLSTSFKTDQGLVQAVRDVSFDVKQGEILGIVGESGSGKSVTMFTVMGLLKENALVDAQSVILDGKDITPKISDKSNARTYEKIMQSIRGNEMAMIFQDPMTFLNPLLRIETQLCEPLMIHQKLSKKEAKQKAITLMEQVGIPSASQRIRYYPHQFSGGMRQRIIIAIALACSPKLIIADEPTTALDVTIQAQVLELIQALRDKQGCSVILITHDLGVVANTCDRILIMYGGKIVERGTDQEIFYNPKHPYTIGLLNSINDPDSEVKQTLKPIPGSPPDLLQPPIGCPFVDRCEQAMYICKEQMPEVSAFSETHFASCWLNSKGGACNE